MNPVVPATNYKDMLKTRLDEAMKLDTAVLIERQLAYLGIKEGALVELQTLPFAKGVDAAYSAYASSKDTVARLAVELNAKDRFGRTEALKYAGVFLVLNRHVAGLEAKHRHGEWIANTGGSTGNEHIAARRAFFIDFDTRRPSGVSSTVCRPEVSAASSRRIFRSVRGEWMREDRAVPASSAERNNPEKLIRSEEVGILGV